jgi:DNA-binding MarR family transcriptional regulator
MERVDCGLTLPQYRIMALVGAGGERSARLAERLAVAKPTLTAAADVLVSAGYLVREAEPGDRRVVRLLLTPAGRAALDRADTAYAEWLEPLVNEAEHPAAVLAGLGELETVLRHRRAARAAARHNEEGGA